MSSASGNLAPHLRMTQEKVPAEAVFSSREVDRVAAHPRQVQIDAIALTNA